MKIKHPRDLDLLSFVIVVVIVAVCFILFYFNIFMDCISRAPISILQLGPETLHLKPL